MLRAHQKETQDICRRIAGGSPNRFICVHCTPGGGKQADAVVAAKELIPTKADRICWVVPRLALQEQAERAFLDPFFRNMLGHRMEIRQSTNEIDPSRDLAGFVTTYQAVAQDGGSLVHEFSRYRYLLVLDEPHHVEEGGVYHRALSPLVDRAAVTLLMSGTLERGDGRRIAFLPYKRATGGEVIDDTATDEWAWVRYSRQEALQERAIIPIHFGHTDARAEWIDRTGTERSITSFNPDDMEAADIDWGEALYAALHTQYAYALLADAVKDWLAHRHHTARSKLLIVSPKISIAKQHLDWLKRSGIKSFIATSEDKASALDAIARFKSNGPNAIDCLVTVAMAYEGLDVPDISHGVCLTYIRSRPWIEQMLARATRYDRNAGEWENQMARWWVPDDPAMQRIIETIRKEQDPFIRDIIERDKPGENNTSSTNALGIVPVGSEATRTRFSELDGAVSLGYEESAQLLAAMEKHNILGISPVQIKRLMLEVGFAAYRNGSDSRGEPAPLVTPTQREKNLRTSIEAHCRKVDLANGWEFGSTNRIVIKEFGKSRDRMTLADLMNVWAWLQRVHPLED